MSESLPRGQFAKLPHQKKLTDEHLAIISKLTPRDNVGRTFSRNRGMELPDASIFGIVANQTARHNSDAKNLFQVLPDMGLAKEILVSAILSPTDMVSTSLSYSLVQNELEDGLTGPMLRVIQDYYDNVYRIKKFLPDMLTDALFMKGAYPMVVLPEVSLDHIINSTSTISQESIKDEVSDGWYRPYGILGTPSEDGKYSSSMENLWDFNVQPAQNLPKEKFEVKASIEGLPGKVYVSDNLSVLRNPSLLDRLRAQRQAAVYGRRMKATGTIPAGTTTGMEGAARPNDKMTLNQTEQLFYRKRTNKTGAPLVNIITEQQSDRRSVGNPLVMNLPSEAVIPVHVPGDVRKHVGYFVLLSIDGHPLSMDYSNDFYNDIRESMQADPNMASQLLSSVRRNTQGANVWSNGDIDHMQQAYQQTVETDLLNRLRSGAITGEYVLGNCQEVYRMMLARQLKSQNTMMLYVPAELMIYIAFDYNEYGVGKSLLEDGKILGSLRSVLLFANTMAAVRNSVDGRNINLTIPQEDEAPYETVAFMLGEYAKINRTQFPIGETNPAQLVSHLQNAGVVVTMQGNTALPEARLDVESRDGTHKMIDKEFDDELRRRHIQTFGLTPETMEASTGADFATQLRTQFMLLLKRVIQYQEEFKPFLTDFIRTYTINSGFLRKELLAVVEEKRTLLPKEYKDDPEAFVDDFIFMIEVSLPSPEVNNLEAQMEGFTKYTEAITTALDAYLKAEALNPLAPQGLEENFESIKASIISMMQRKYLREKNILPELDLFNTLTEDEDGPGFDLLEESNKHNEGVLRSVEGFVKKVLKEAKKREARLEKINAEKDALGSGGAEGGTDDFGGGTDDFGGDDTGGELDTGAVDGDGVATDDTLASDDFSMDDTGGTDDVAADPDTTEPAADGELDLDLDVDAEPDAEPTETTDANAEVETTDGPVEDADAKAVVEEEPADTDVPEEEEEESIDLDIPEKPADIEEEEETTDPAEEEQEVDVEIPETPKGEEEELEDDKKKKDDDK